MSDVVNDIDIGSESDSPERMIAVLHLVQAVAWYQPAAKS